MSTTVQQIAAISGKLRTWTDSMYPVPFIQDEFMWAPTVIHGGFSAAEVEEINTCGKYSGDHSWTLYRATVRRADGKRRKSRPC